MRPQRCTKDGFPMDLDLETMRRSVQSGYEPIEVYKCRNGHSCRLHPPTDRAEPNRPRGHMVPCVYCGNLYRRTNGMMRFCSGNCKWQVRKLRDKAARTGTAFLMEAEPWYQGPGSHLYQPERTQRAERPDAPCGTSWLEGWARWYNYPVDGTAA